MLATIGISIKTGAIIRKVPKVTELETIHATAEQQQEEMERLLLKKNNNE
jgi:5-methylcytosine-specific restriction endonuclease McrBC regulatory subunit McrC